MKFDQEEMRRLAGRYFAGEIAAEEERELFRFLRSFSTGCRPKRTSSLLRTSVPAPVCSSTSSPPSLSPPSSCGSTIDSHRGRKAAIGKILRQLCEWKGVKIIEAEACPEHIHLFVEIPPKISVSGFMGYLKGKSAAMMYEQFVELKYKYRSKEFWCKGYYVDTVGKNEGRIAEYIKNQLKEDQLGDQLSIPL